MSRIRQHLTYANVVATIALFIAISGGTAVALNGTNTVFTDDVADDTRPASGGNPAGGLVAADLRPNSVGTSEVTNESLTGQDIKNQSGVDTCTHGTVRFGELCVGVANEGHTWEDALLLCQNLNLRLPSYGEALALGKNYDLPSLDPGDFFWAEEKISSNNAYGSNDSGGKIINLTSVPSQDTVCVTTPTN